MPDQWDSYICTVNAQLASIFVNLGLRANAPDPNLPVFAAVWLQMKQPRYDGLSSNEEAEVLGNVEEALNKAFTAVGAEFAGRITTQSRRQFYFYAPYSALERIGETMSDAMKTFPDYEYDPDIHADPSWRQYFKLLCPTPEQERSMENRKTIAALRDAGDGLTEPRPVTHTAYFQSENERNKFAKWADEQGFSTERINSTDKIAGKPWGAIAIRTDEVDQESIDIITVEMDARIRALTGKYDGWEAEVIPAAKEAAIPAFFKKVFGAR